MKLRQDSLGFLLADVSRLMRRAFQQRLEGSSLTLAQARALVYVGRHEDVRQVDLADMLEVQPITLARLIDQLANIWLRSEKLLRRSRPMFYAISTNNKPPPFFSRCTRCATTLAHGRATEIFLFRSRFTHEQ